MIDRAGYIYFSEYQQPLLRRITPSGQVEVFAGCATCNDVDGAPATQSSFGSVAAMSFDAGGNLYLASTNGVQGHLYRISSDGIIHHFAGFGSTGFGPQSGNGGPALAAPPSKFVSVATDVAGNVYTEESIYTVGGVAVRRIGTDGNINVIAGDFTGLDPPNDGPALQTGLTGGGASSLSTAGAVLTFADYRLIREITSEAIQTTAGGQPQPAPNGTPALSAWFIQPNSIAFNSAGELYVGQSCIIQKINSSGVLSTIAGTGQCNESANSISPGPALTTRLTPVDSIVVDSHNQVYFVDYLGALYMVSTEGVISNVVELSIYGGPNLLAIDSHDHIYFLTYVLDALGLVVPGAAPQLVNPPPSPEGGFQALGLAVDAADNIYACCDALSTILRYSSDLQSYTALNLGGPGVGGPHALAIDSSSNIWQGLGVIGLYKGSFPFGGCCVYADGGPAESTRIEPSALAFAPDGDLYELDSGTD